MDSQQQPEDLHQSAKRAIEDSQQLVLPATDDVLALADWPDRSPFFRKVSVSKRLYFFVFILITLFLSVGTVRVYHNEEDPFFRLERMVSPTGTTGPGLPSSDVRMAEQLGYSLEQLQTTEDMLNKIYTLNTRRTLGPLDWGINIHVSGYTTVISYRIFVNMAIALVISVALYLLARSQEATKIIEAQNNDFRKLTETLKIKIFEAEKYLDELTQAQSKLVQAQKLASIGRLSATLAHEIRNPMSIIKSAASFAQGELDKTTPGARALETVKLEVERLNTIITHLLDFASPKPPSLDEADLNEMLNSWCVGVADQMKEANIQLIIKKEDRPLPVMIDSNQLYQIFLNLLWNARDALSEQEAERRIMVITDTAGPHTVTLTVEDNGPGMSEETLSQIFEPFFTTKTHGTGLGLPMVQQLMEGMRGQVLIESEQEKGARVVLVMRSSPKQKSLKKTTSPAPYIEEEPTEEEISKSSK